MLLFSGQFSWVSASVDTIAAPTFLDNVGLSSQTCAHFRFIRFELLPPKNTFSLRIWEEDDGVKFSISTRKELTVQTGECSLARGLVAESQIEFNNLTFDSSGVFIANTGPRSGSAVRSMLVEPLRGASFMAMSGCVDFGAAGLDFFRGYDPVLRRDAPTYLRFVNVGSFAICLDTRLLKSFRSPS